MAILEKEVWVGLNHMNTNYYEKLGYKIPRIINIRGKLIIPNGTKILVKIDDLQLKSIVKLTKICDECGLNKPNQRYDSITKSRIDGDGKDRCFECGKKKARVTLLDSIKYENSLEYLTKINNKEYLLNEYSEKNEKKPNEIAYMSSQKYIWNCPRCKSEYRTTAESRTNMDSNCPYCSGKLVNHTNSLWSLRPDIASLLKYKEKGHKLTLGSNKYQLFICANCEHEQRKMINTVVKQGFLSCSRCSDGISYSEKLMVSILNQLSIEYEKEKVFNWANNKRYDFYIKELNCIIETHGSQHYGVGYQAKGARSLEEEQKNDQFKMNIALSNGIEKYIVVDCSKSDKVFIKNSIMNTSLVNLFDLNIIDWDKCNEFAVKNNMLKKVCDLWNSGIRNTVEIGKIVKLERGTVANYLKRGKQLSWCDYDPKEVQRQNGIVSGHQTGKRKVIQLTLSNEFIKEWKSMKEAMNELGISNIYNACKGKYNHAGGFKWLYKEDYDNLIRNN